MDPQQHGMNVSLNAMMGVDAVDCRVPQWGLQETRELLLVRAELDRNFLETKRNKLLWEVVATTMRDKGFNRTPDQCKCKWKNLVTRYKGCESLDPEAVRQQFPFYNELQHIFTARMQRMLWDEAGGRAGGGPSTSLRRKTCVSSEDDEDNGDEDGIRGKTIKKKGKMSSGNDINGLREVLEELTKQQLKMDARWEEAYEARERERVAKEMEWRRNMQALETERNLMDRRWKEKEEQWRVREEGRAEKRDALITALLNKLRTRDGI